MTYSFTHTHSEGSLSGICTQQVGIHECKCTTHNYHAQTVEITTQCKSPHRTLLLFYHDIQHTARTIITYMTLPRNIAHAHTHTHTDTCIYTHYHHNHHHTMQVAMCTHMHLCTPVGLVSVENTIGASCR